MTNPWDKIFENNFEAAYVIADHNYSQTSQDFDLRARAICLLLLQRYNDSLSDFLKLSSNEKQTNRTSDGTYMHIALCYYAMGKNDKAVEYFKFPVINRKQIKYTSDISVPSIVLLFIGSQLDKQDLTETATKELRRISKYNIAAPSYLLGLNTEEDLDKQVLEQTDGTLRNRRQCKNEFYKAIASFQNGDTKKYKEHIKTCVKLTGKYLEFEYYLARIEFDKLNYC